MMIFTCDNCHYSFCDEKVPEQCPDCGKFKVRPATKAEEQDLIDCKEKGQSW